MDQPATAGSFRIDRERAPEAIRDLESALAELVDIKRQAEVLGHVDPGSGDSVSRDAAIRIGQAAVGGPRSLSSAIDAGIIQLRDLIREMNDELRAYDAAEQQTSASFGNPNRA